MKLTIYKQRRRDGRRYATPLKIGDNIAWTSGPACAFNGDRLTGELHVLKVTVAANGMLLDGVEELPGERFIVQSWFCAQEFEE